MKKNKVLWILLGIFGVLILFVIIGNMAGWIGGGEAVRVSTAKAEKRTIIETVTASGKIYPEKEVKISPEVSGEVTGLFINEGDSVKQGEKLVDINPDVYQAQLERMQASLNTSKANLSNAKARLIQVKAKFEKTKSDYERNKKLYQDGVISESEFEAAESNFESAKADVEAATEDVNAARYQVESARASLREARDKLGKTTIYAPVDGIVSKLDVEEGERVVGTAQFEGTELLRIANMNTMEVRVDVSENDIVRVTVGDTADIQVDAYRDRTFGGVVTQVASSASNLSDAAAATDQVTNFTVKIRVFQSSYADLQPAEGEGSFPLRPGMSASVDIQTDKSVNTLSVPIQAVTIREKESDKKKKEMQEMVFLYKNEKAIARDVKTGIQDDTYIEVLEGLKNEDEVISAPYNAISKELEDSSTVEKVESKKALWKE